MGSLLNSPIFIDYGEFFMNGSNILSVPYQNVTAAFTTPVAINSTTVNGFDWTQPYPGSSKDGHTVYLKVAQEMALPESIVENATTVLSSLTFGIPDSMISGSQPLAMDASWYICRHVFISTKPEVKLAVDGGSNCGFLSNTCQADLKASLTRDWGNAADGTMCSALGFDPIPPSCQDSFGFARQDVMAFDAAFLANTTLAPVQTSKEQQQYSWRIGTGYHDPGDTRAYASAANRTYLLATVWGYSQDSESRQVPEVSLSCLSSGTSYGPPSSGSPPPTTTTTTATSSSTSSPTQTSISSNAAFNDDFSSGSMAQWTIYDGSFDASSGELVGSNSFGGKALVNSQYDNFIYQVDVTIPSSSGNAGLIFRVTDPGVGADSYNGYYAGISTSGVFVGRVSNSWSQLGSATKDLGVNQAHHIKIEVVDAILNIFVDDMNSPLVSVTDDTYTKGMNGVRVYGMDATFDNVRINPLIFRDEFSSGSMSKWTTIDGQYQVSSNVAEVTASPAAKAVITGVTSQNIIYEADVSIDSTPNGNGGMIFRVSNAKPGADTYNGYYVGIGIGYVVFGFADTNWNEIRRVEAADIVDGQVHHLVTQTLGDSISIFVDDLNTPRMVVKDDKYSYAGLNGVRGYTTTMSVSNVRIYAA
jgi:hypothetical protein